MTHLPCKWAERSDRVFITVDARSAVDVQVQFTDSSVSISGQGVTARGSEPHELKDTLTLFKEIDPSASTFQVTGAGIYICGLKKEAGYWTRLVDEPVKATKNWLSVDWSRWKDEDEEQADDLPDPMGGNGDMSSMFAAKNGMGGMDDAMHQDYPDSDDEENDEELKDLDE